MPIEYILGVRNLIKGLEGEVRDFKLGMIWGRASPDQKKQLLEEFPLLFEEFAEREEVKARNAATEARQRAWLIRHPVIRWTWFGLLAVAGPYLFLSKRMRWLFSVGRFSDPNAPRP